VMDLFRSAAKAMMDALLSETRKAFPASWVEVHASQFRGGCTALDGSLPLPSERIYIVHGIDQLRTVAGCPDRARKVREESGLTPLGKWIARAYMTKLPHAVNVPLRASDADANRAIMVYFGCRDDSDFPELFIASPCSKLDWLANMWLSLRKALNLPRRQRFGF
jgi:hypothetical protein